MALKKNLTKDEFKKLPPDVAKEYKEDGDGYILDLEGGFEDVSALKRAKDHEKKEAAEAKRLLKDAQDQLAAVQQEMTDMLKGAIPKGDVEKLESSYKTKLAAREKELQTQIDAMQSNLQTMLVDNVATSLASEISTVPGVILPHIAKRLKAEKGEDGKFVTRVLDADGKPSASTVDDLKKEFLTNKQFAPILIGSKGSGGGASGAGGGGANAGKKPDFAKASVAEIKAWNESQGVGSETFVRTGGSQKQQS